MYDAGGIRIPKASGVCQLAPAVVAVNIAQMVIVGGRVRLPFCG